MYMNACILYAYIHVILIHVGMCWKNLYMWHISI